MSPESDEIISFLQRLDKLIPDKQDLDLYLSGGAAVLIAYAGSIATKDVDAIGRSEGLLRVLQELTGKEFDIHIDTGLYLDLVSPWTLPLRTRMESSGSAGCGRQPKEASSLRAGVAGSHP